MNSFNDIEFKTTNPILVIFLEGIGNPNIPDIP